MNFPEFQNYWFNEAFYIALYFIVAYLVALTLSLLARVVIRLGGRLPFSDNFSDERQETLQILLANALRMAAYVIAFLASVGRYVDADTLAWMFGLFSAAFSFGARPLISDYLSGLSFIFEDTFAVGEKIELPGAQPIEGIVETINLRTSSLRAPTGELFVVPNGEIRTVRNFSRGEFTIVRITLNILSEDLERTIELLNALGVQATYQLPNLIEPWMIISTADQIGQHTELSLIAKSKFGKSVELKPNILQLVHEHCAEADIKFEV